MIAAKQTGREGEDHGAEMGVPDRTANGCEGLLAANFNQAGDRPAGRPALDETFGVAAPG
jgi:hypothetical protein